MAEILVNQSLKHYNTFGFDVTAKWFCVISAVEDLLWLMEQPIYQQNEKLFLGGGSNVLLRDDFNGLVIVNRILGYEIVYLPANNYTIVKAGAGENWHQFVLRTIQDGLGGIENLSLIPGTVGAAPMQNIGAYGVEIKDVFDSLEAINLETGIIEKFNKKQCRFGYRESVFKHELKAKYLICSVSFKLKKAADHKVSIHYGAIKEVLAQQNISSPSIRAVSDAVIAIRRSKLPDPEKIGNSGSFFKNPIISKSQFDTLKMQYNEMPGYEVSEHEVKLAAGWLIEQAGWKGYQEHGVGVHDNQALVLVNKGQGSGKEIAHLAKKIQDSIHTKFGVKLIPEVNFV